MVSRRGSYSILTWLSLLSDLALLALGVYYLLLVYRRIGKPEGADPEYDAGYRRWSGTYRLLGWGWVAPSILGLIGTLVGFIGQTAER
jgi:hypothetical protein